MEEFASHEEQHGIYYIEKIAEGVFKIYEQRAATMYLVCGRKRACLIDTAFGLCDLKALAAKLTDLPVMVVNTHGHTDHVLGNHWFCESAGCAYMHPADKPLYEETVLGFADMVRSPEVQEAYGAFIRDLDPSLVRFPPVRDLREGDVIDLGGKTLEVIEAPGHTAGSILLMDREDRLCFSGDAIIEHVWLFLEESLSPDVYLSSLRRAQDALENAGIERIYDGHYSYTPLTLPKLSAMIAGMESIVQGKAAGAPFENHAGSGVEYTFGEWSALCRK